VQVTHGAVLRFLLAMQRELRVAPADRVLALTTLAFDISVLEILLPLSVGARTVVVDEATARDARALAHALRAGRASVVQATPTTWRMLLDAGWESDASLRLLCGGEPMARDLATRLLATGAALWNVYGPTETCVWSSLQRVAPGVGPVPLGEPLAGTRLLVLDESGRRPVPDGAIGELYIGGAGLARGYLGRPGLTAERFVPDPFAERPGERLYRTGDLVRRRHDGELHFVGRRDGQVKLHGRRIELGEVEAVLRTHPAVREAAASVVGEAAESRLVAHVVLAPGDATPSVSELRTFLAERLAAYMVPSLYVFLAALPRTAGGKLDRKALPAPDGARPDLGAPFVAPRGQAEQRVAEIWARVLGLARPGVEDNFFELGGTSLSLIEVQGRLSEELGVDVPVVELFRHPTVRALAALVVDGGRTEPATLAPARLAAQQRRDRLRRRRAAAAGPP
jgi:acyl-coenzyme A synthetase/AMP-(fatty) acid ligase/acyl carrier protein